jgi:hypothetical protein
MVVDGHTQVAEPGVAEPNYQYLGHSSAATTSRYLYVRPGESSARFLSIKPPSPVELFSKNPADPASAPAGKTS